MADTENAATLGSPGQSAPAPQRDPDDLTGQDLADGRYTLLEVIGQGGMGTVYRARHNAIGKTVAIKVLSQRYARRADWVERFVREARATSKVDHEHVIEIFDCGTTPTGTAFIAMELLEGESLADTIESEGALPWLRSKTIILQVCRALHAAHTRGVIHRDMKPDNCFRSKRGANRDFIKVLDFGLAKVFGDERDPVKSITTSGTIFGTPEYMSPEQARGAKVDHRTDIYAVGVMLYQLVTGVVPFADKSFMMVLTRQTTEPPIPPSQRAPQMKISPALDAIILKALEKQADQRYQSIREMAEAIAALPHDAVTTRMPATSSGPVELPVQRSTRDRTLIAVLLVLVVVLAAGLAAALLLR